MRVGLVGDFTPEVTAHRAIPEALALAGAALGTAVEPVWVGTETIESADRLASFDAIWCVPGSPYRSSEGALRAIGLARERGVAFLGTCGGFQHALLEYARAVLGLADAGHAEERPDASRPVIAPLACSLVEVEGTVRLRAGSRIAQAYDAEEARESYHCRYGLHPAFREALLCGPLRATAEDAAGEVRAVELSGHPFFVATLFQPERAALEGRVPPLAEAFLRSAWA
jgi:CTP synthase (UTP-ammonia lyase)